MEKGKTITVKGIEQVAKSKPDAKKEWIMYKVVDQDDVEYKTFEIMSLGSPYQISYEEEPKKPFVAKKGPEAGKMITPKGVDRFIKRAVITDAPPMGPAPQSGTGQQGFPKSPTEARFDAIESRLKVLEDANRAEF